MERISERHMGRRVSIICVGYPQGYTPPSDPIVGRILLMDSTIFHFIGPLEEGRPYRTSELRKLMWRITKVY